MRKIYLPFITTYSYPNHWFVFFRSSLTSTISTITKKQEDQAIASMQKNFPFFTKTEDQAFAVGFTCPAAVTITNNRREGENRLEDGKEAIKNYPNKI